MNVSASLDVKIGSGSSLKYCFNMSAMSYGDKPSKSVLSVSEQQQMITLSFIVSYNWVSYRSSTFFTLCMISASSYQSPCYVNQGLLTSNELLHKYGKKTALLLMQVYIIHMTILK